MTTGLLLLVLTGHAFVVSATHFHPGRQAVTIAAADGAQVVQFSDTAPPAGGHEQCLLCRLQRNFVSDLPHSAPALAAPPADALGHSRSFDASARRAHLFAPSGRAPPSA